MLHFDKFIGLSLSRAFTCVGAYYVTLCMLSDVY